MVTGSQSANAREDQQIDEMIAQALEGVAKGENPDQILEVMLAELPVKLREKIQRKFAAALAKRNLKPLKGEADIPSRGTLARIRDLFTLSTKQARDRIIALTRTRPDVQQTIAQAGRILIRNGVVYDKVEVSEADLGTMAPVAAVNQAQDRGTGRG